MVLSSDLISQFAKITKDKEKTNKERMVYGTTVDVDGVIQVKLDGSDLTTPVLSTAYTQAGERVIVMIKNHTATITGNLSSPSARNEDVQGAVDSSSEATANVAILTKELAAIEDTLDDHSNSIDNLQQNVLSLNDRFAKYDESILEYDDVKETLTKYGEEIDLIKETLTKYGEEIDLIKETQTTQAEEIANINSIIEELRTAVEELQGTT